jgi:hypothetical protein
VRKDGEWDDDGAEEDDCEEHRHSSDRSDRGQSIMTDTAIFPILPVVHERSSSLLTLSLADSQRR